MKTVIEKLISRLCAKKELIWYLFFGVCTVAVNTVCYELMYTYVGVSNLLSTFFAWFVAVVFAFFTNKTVVFNSKCTTAKERIKEAAYFFLCRSATGLLDILIMVIAVDYLHGCSVVWKLISSIIVTVVNYIVSKTFIFKKQ